ncbi:helix-turn-helix transcriptional regulator [Paenibacillus sp. FSL H8-0548]|uniref:helix-turn-helix domain-containing protein n=2 Tax=Paenibacillus sp. FSL H8-0548 TaxID=1920422 RepID=UPI0009FB0302
MEMYGERLRLRRTAKGLTQNQLGALIGSPGRTISRHEQSKNKPKSAVVGKIEGVLGEF